MSSISEHNETGVNVSKVDNHSQALGWLVGRFEGSFNLIVILAVCCGLVFGATAATAADTYHVSSDGGDDDNDGSGWFLAFETLQHALGEAASGDTIKVGQGTYTPCDGDLKVRTASFQMVNNVYLKGGYAGPCACVDPDLRDYDLYETILSGDLEGDDAGTPGTLDDNSYHVVTAGSRITAALTLVQGFTISGGYSDGSTDATKQGGGLQNGYASGGSSSPGGTFTVQNCKFEDNYATDKGGAMMTRTGNLILTDCEFNDNTTGDGGDGGGVCTEGTMTLTGCSFTNNTTAVAGDGAGLHASASIDLTDCTFTTNTATDAYCYGGAVYVSDDADFDNCDFDENEAGSRGGAVYCDGALTATFTNGCEFTGNVSNGYGGAVHAYYGTTDLSFTDCEFSANTAPEWGGAIHTPGDLTLLRCDFENNVADASGGAVHKALSSGTYLTVTACRFEGNTTGQEGGAVYAGGYYNDYVSFVNTLFATNTAGGEIHVSPYVPKDGFGGAVYSKSGGSFINCTFADNVADDDGAGGQGGGIYEEVVNATITATNCIFKDNLDDGGNDESSQIHIAGGDAAVTYTALSTCDETFGGFCYDDDDHNVDATAEFLDAGDHPYRLDPEESANDDLIDEGDGVSTGTSENDTSVDLEGIDRFVDVNAMCTQTTTTIDMGAYEVPCDE